MASPADLHWRLLEHSEGKIKAHGALHVGWSLLDEAELPDVTCEAASSVGSFDLALHVGFRQAMSDQCAGYPGGCTHVLCSPSSVI